MQEYGKALYPRIQKLQDIMVKSMDSRGCAHPASFEEISPLDLSCNQSFLQYLQIL
jgi:hypothetical protein